ncbi:hypothetical protein DFP73DRAFT_630099 [Morchella snyderi]|nr:hypothetical protein DFP73DRAFT_630099 [Morchella snyderi]
MTLREISDLTKVSLGACSNIIRKANDRVNITGDPDLCALENIRPEPNSLKGSNKKLTPEEEKRLIEFELQDAIHCQMPFDELGAEAGSDQWLNKLCPYFEELDDVLIRDKSYNPHYVSKTGGPLPLQVFNGNSQQSMPTIPEDKPVTDKDNPDGLEFHPPARGQKNSLKRRESASGSGKHTGAIKGLKKSSGEEISRDYPVARLDFERELFVYEKKRDSGDLKLLEKKEENRHLETMCRFDSMIKKMEMMDSSQYPSTVIFDLPLMLLNFELMPSSKKQVLLIVPLYLLLVK